MATLTTPQNVRIEKKTNRNGTFYYIYDANGNRLNNLPIGGGTLRTWASSNGYILPSGSGTAVFDETKTPWYKDVTEGTDKGKLFNQLVEQANIVGTADNFNNAGAASFDNPIGSPYGMVWDMTKNLYDKGVTNLYSLTTEGNNVVTQDGTKIGTLDNNTLKLGTTYAGDGATTYNLTFSNGYPIVYTGGFDTSSGWVKDLATVAGIGSMFIPGLNAAAAAALGGITSGLAGGDPVTGALLAGAGNYLKTSDVLSNVSQAVGEGVAGSAAAGAVSQGTLAALAGKDPLEAAIQGAVTGGITEATPALSEALGGDVAGQAATGALVGGAKAALTGGDVLESALKSAALSGAAAATFEPQLPTESYDYASDAAQLAEQGLSSSQITDILGAADAAPDLASSLASYAVNAVDQGLTGPDVANYINNEFTADVQFAAADANQLFDQGLSNAQVGEVIDATGVPSAVSSLGQDASFIAADAQQLWDQTNNVGAVEQNLLATGVDPIVAATVANDVAMGATTNELTDTLLQASDPATLTTENTLFSENNMLPTSADLSPIKTSVVAPTETIPAVQATQQPEQQQSSLVNDVFLIDPNRNTLFQNPFLRSNQSFQGIVGGLFNG